jgi:hypothetical protein
MGVREEKKVPFPSKAPFVVLAIIWFYGDGIRGKRALFTSYAITVNCTSFPEKSGEKEH